MARTAMLRHDQVGDRFQHITGSKQWSESKVFLADDTFGCATRLSAQVQPPALDDNLLENVFVCQ